MSQRVPSGIQGIAVCLSRNKWRKHRAWWSLVCLGYCFLLLFDAAFTPPIWRALSNLLNLGITKWRWHIIWVYSITHCHLRRKCGNPHSTSLLSYHSQVYSVHTCLRSIWYSSYIIAEKIWKQPMMYSVEYNYFDVYFMEHCAWSWYHCIIINT